VLRQLDAEVPRIVETQHARARKILEERVALLREAAKALLAQETLSGEELRAIASRVGFTPEPAPARATA